MAVWVSIVSTVGGREPSNGKPDTIDFGRQIRPILAKQCFACHGPDKKESGLALNQFDTATIPADSGSIAIVPSDISASELLRRVKSDDPSERMPPEGPGLSPTQIQALETWIASGAQYRDHWAFLPLSRPRPPVVQSTHRLCNAIDAFIAERWERWDLRPAPTADPRALVRRLYFDCLGVPPDLETVENFANHPTDQAYEAMVDELLADPRFGERAARSWLDVVRYAETNSFERDGIKPNAWKYRDYVIRSMNQDRPYDRFIIEQLAGDEIDDPTLESMTATGFYRLGIWDDEPADPLQARFDEFDDLVTTIGQGLMGLTMNCARCHDHKIDPIPQKDYYQLVAFLRDVTSFGIRGDEKTNSQIDVSPPQVKAQLKSLKESISQMQSTLRSIEDQGIAQLSDEDKLAAKGPDRSKVIQEKLKGALEPSQWERYSEIKRNLEADRKAMACLPQESLLGLAKCDPKPDPTHVLVRGSPHAPGDVVEPGFPAIFKTPLPQLDSSENAKTSGRRRVLAQWLVSPDNRLTGRVIVNRLWQQHFGRGLVRSANNFGQMGDPPTHPELLDFLVDELVASGFHLKSIHRMMLLSSTYRLSSLGDESSIAKDPVNDYFSRFNTRRLSAEELRDATLSVTGRIDWKQFGPSIYPDVSDDVKAGQSVPGNGWQSSSDADKSRRSIYIHIKRSLIPPELSVFDFPETDISCEARFLTTQAAQALNMLNGAFMQQQASRLFDRVQRESATNGAIKPVNQSLTQKIQTAIELAYSRRASDTEVQRAMKRIASLQAKFTLTEDQALREYCLILLNSNEFMYVD